MSRNTRITFLLLPVFLFLLIFCPSSQSKQFSSPQADKILVEKSKRTLSLLKDGKTIKTYKIGLGPNPVGHKTEEGDGKTPEGIYIISGRNPKSAYHYSLRISYPNPEDRAQAKQRGVSPGGDVMIHGLPKNWGWAETFMKEPYDWTLGCISVTNSEIEEIAKAVPNGTKIEILP